MERNNEDPSNEEIDPQSEIIEQINQRIAELEQERNSTIVPIFFTDRSSIDDKSVSEIYEFCEFDKRLDDVDTLEIILHSGGGDLDAALHLCQILRSYPKKCLKIIVPRYAKSAATMIALSGDSLVMDRPSELGPLNPLWTEAESGEVFDPQAIPKSIEFLNEIEQQLEPNSRIIEIIANKLSVERMGLYKASLDYAVPPTIELLSTRMFNGDEDGEEKANAIAKRLARGYPQHGYPVGLTEAERLGLKLERMPHNQWEKVWRIWRLFNTNFI